MNLISRIYGGMLAFLLLAGISMSCTDVDALSDANGIKSFTVTSHTPDAIELGTVEITDKDEILIPVSYGADKFPLKFRADVRFESDIDQVAGVDFNNELVLKSITDEIPFIVMAQSGMPRRYVIRPVELAYEAPDYMMMKILSVTPSRTLVFDKAIIEDDVMTMFVINPEYPLSITPEFILDSDKTELPGFNNGNSTFVFNSFESAANLAVKNKELGTTRDLTVRVEPLAIVTGEQEGSEVLDLMNSDITVKMKGEPAGTELMGFRITHVKDSITLILDKIDGNTAFPLSFDVEFADFGDDTGFPGLSNPLTMTFKTAGDEFYFYSADINSRMARRWKVVLREWVEPGEAQILSMTYSYTATNVGLFSKPCITLSGYELYPSGNLWLRMTGYNAGLGLSTWLCTLKDVELEVSDGATYILPDLVYSGPDSWKEVREITVTSREGDTKVWKFGIKDSRSSAVQSAEREIHDITVKNILPIMASVNLGDPYTINASEKTITIRLDEDENSYPMSVWLDYRLSDFARVTSQEQNTLPLVFATPESTQEIVVEAENGESDTWTVSLIPPQKTGGANVTGFRVNSYSSVFQTDYIKIDEETGEITIHLLNGGSCPVTVNYGMSISRNSRATIPLKGSFVFDRLSDVKEFKVISESATKDWTIKFADFAPQIQGANMDNWTNDNLYVIPTGSRSAPYWSSANMKVLVVTVENTKRTEGAPDNGYAAGLTTGTSAGKLASGSLFLGWFDKSDPLGNMNDAPVMVFQGIPFASTRKIKGVEVDVWYKPGGAPNSDAAALTAELILQRDPSKDLEYHGMGLDGNMHVKNNADRVAHGKIVLGTIDEGAKTEHDDTVTKKVADSTWERIFIPIEYSGDFPIYSHLGFICASSSMGDFFKGTIGSQLKLDNVTIIYEN